MELKRHFFGSIDETHSQRGKIERLAAKKAEATCVDCVTYELVRRHRREVATRERILAEPSIPFVTSVKIPDELRSSIKEALMIGARAPKYASMRAGLMIRDIVPANLDAYEVQLSYKAEARGLGYPELK